MNVHFSGGACEIGASCILIEICGKKILLDCGMRQTANKDPLPDFRMIQELGGVDSIIVSHAHLDHTGTLPLISKEYPQAKIYMNKITNELIRVLLYDSIKIMNYREGEIPLYSEKDVEEMFSRIFCVNYEVEFKLDDDIYFTFYPAGHIAGASFVSIKSKEGILFYSGDFSTFSQKTIEGARIPRIRHATAIIESTYGDKLHANRELEEERLIALIEECTASGGKMLIPSFALGRAQEIILIIKKAKNKNRLKDLPVYVDGMIRNITRVYSQNPLFLKANLGRKLMKGIDAFYDKTIMPVSDKVKRNNILASKDPMVIISSSGMLHGGYSQLYAEYIAPNENNFLVFSGYQDEESPGHLLLSLADKEKEERKLCFDQKIIPVKCRIEKIGLSAHSDKSEIKNVISLIKPDNIFLVHGDESIIHHLGNDIIAEFDGNLYIPSSGESYEIETSEQQRIRKKRIPYRMSETENLNNKNIGKLWEFVFQNYKDKYHTIEDYICIWNGKRYINPKKVHAYHKLIADSVYFESDNKRLFLLRAKSKERIDEELKNTNEYKQQDIEELVQEYFAPYDYSKAGYYMDTKKVVLTFDFPLALPDEILKDIRLFQTETGWNIEVYKETNTNALEVFIKQLFSSASIKKISHHIHEGKVVINLDKQYGVKDELAVFKEKTGLSLEVRIQDQESSEKTVIYDKSDTIDMRGNILFEASYENRMEQNNAFNYIDSQLADEEFRPYKRGLKNDHTGKYIELSFISPIVGKRLSKKIAAIASNIGWNITISKSFNQNEISHLARKLCEENGIKLIKNPSFNQNSCSVTIKAEIPKNDEQIDMDAINNEFIHETGCVLKIDFS